MLGLADILVEDPEQCLPEDYRRYLEMLKNSGQALLELVDHILDLTKYQSGVIHLDIKKVDLKKVVEAAADELVDQFKRQQCQFVVDWPERTPWVYGDEAELKHLLRDLLGNAVKFTHQGTIAVSPAKCGEMLKVCIRDTGIGIEEKDQHRIFEDFQQADGDKTREYGGSGLGLALAKKIVELHGGRIWVESKKKVGSHFYFTLPLNPSHLEVKAPAGSAEA
ncbi:MAG: HAMP domain-containing sensor histidine kinase [bacterium]